MIIVVIVTFIMLIPVMVMVMTAFKSRAAITTPPPKVFFHPTLEGFLYLFTDRALLNPDQPGGRASQPGALGFWERLALENGQQINGT